jgi:hypothetical protein
MKVNRLLILSFAVLALTLTMVSADPNNPVIDDFEGYDLGDDASSVWDLVYNYEDAYSTGGAEVIEDGSQVLEVSRAYLWHDSFSRFFFGKMKVFEASEDYLWYGSRLALVNPENAMERYEVRLYPNTDRVFVKYVDKENDYSETLAKTECKINLDQWYHTLIMRGQDNKWRAMVFSGNNPTCMVRWQDDRITVENPVVGIQSAGKYVTSRFDEIFAI